MSDNILRQELFYMVKLADNYDLKDKEVVDLIIEQSDEANYLNSAFGVRFKKRILDLSQGIDTTHKCVICGNRIAQNGVICQDCMSQILNSEYAHQLDKEKNIASKIDDSQTEEIDSIEAENKSSLDGSTTQNERFSFSKIIKIFKAFVKSKVVAIVLGILFVLQLSLLITCKVAFYSPYHKADLPPDSGVVNPLEEPKISSRELVYSESVEDAFKVVAQEFPQKDGWEIKTLNPKEYYMGSFLVEKGENVNEYEQKLTDEERVNYYIIEKCYAFIVSYRTQNCLKLGTVVVRPEGQVIVQGVFNDGREANSFYRIR